MATPVVLPKQGNSVESCIIQSWLKQPGDSVSAGDAICEVETDKAVVEVEAPADGVLIETFVAPEDDVPVLSVIAAIGEAGEDISDIRPQGESEAAAAAVETEAIAEAPSANTAAAAPTATAPSSPTGAGSSPRARAAASEAGGVDVNTLAGTGPGGLVIERDVAAAIAGRAKLSPAAKAALAADPSLGVPERGSGPDGLIKAEDLIAGGSAAPATAATPAAATGSGASTEIKVKGIRKVVAERMHQSLSSTAQLTLTARFEATAIQAWRANAKTSAEALGLPKITINDIVLFAVSRVLPQFPELNAHWLGDRIVQFADIHLGVAVDTPRGLLVPVLRNTQALSLAGIASAFRPLATATIDGSVAPDDLDGGTFTVTNLGALGIDAFTPVLNVPQVAILGVGAPVLAPKRTANGVDHVDYVTVSLTIDHQAVDGAPAARFLNALTSALENIDTLLAL